MTRPTVPTFTGNIPSRQNPDTFSADTDSYLAQLPGFVTGMNNVGEFVETTADAAALSATNAATSETKAAASATVAQGAANYKGEYNVATLYAVGESVSYLGGQFVKKSTAPAGTTPVDGVDWLKVMLSAANVQEFTSSGTWTKPEGATFVQVYAIGGGGGGSNRTTATNDRGGGSGGEGLVYTFQASDLGSTETVTIGAGGAGTANGVTNFGAAGGNTTFGSHVTALGGLGGQSSTRRIARASSGSDDSSYSTSAGYGGGPTQDGGNTVYGGGGGGGASFDRPGGTSEFGGDGGAGSSVANTKAGNGAAKGGGGGGSINDGGGGDGGDGWCRVISW